MKINVLQDQFSDTMDQVYFSQPYQKANLSDFFKYLFYKNKPIRVDKTIWIEITSIIFNSTEDSIVIASVLHQYNVSVNNILPMHPIKRKVNLVDNKNKSYLFSINSVDEIKMLTKLYCEDFSLHFFIFNHEKKDIRFSDFVNFNFKDESEQNILITKSDLFISFGANADWMSIIYKKHTFLNKILPVINYIKNRHI